MSLGSNRMYVLARCSKVAPNNRGYFGDTRNSRRESIHCERQAGQAWVDSTARLSWRQLALCELTLTLPPFLHYFATLFLQVQTCLHISFDLC